MKLTDTHCHLDNPQFDADRDETIERALAAGVTRMVSIGTGDGPPDLEAGIRLADRYDCIFATVGVHPHDAAKPDRATFQRLAGLLSHPKVVAVGEIGLDNHYDFAPRNRQHETFIEQMHIAGEAGKPIVIHTREAWADTFALLEEHWRPYNLPGIMHCFSGGPEEATRSVALGFYLGFGGVLTYPRAQEVREAALQAPLDRILTETDAPYLAPVPKRGKRNEPAYVVEAAKRLAELRSIPLEDLAAATSANFERLCLPRAKSNM